ncbi:glycosyltransferase family 2 protein [Candidatus Saccharibacteria bacterium]|nr:MAG: glycosyltransferase family 2 protein [Candidatus Saccharibacteria bacterium]
MEKAHSAKKVCIVIPAYNEGSVIRSVVSDITKKLQNEDLQFEVVVIDDGSRDNTADEARKGGATVIRHILNSGAGAATATGLSYAHQNNFDIAATMDADGQHSSADVVKGIKTIEEKGADLLIGSRLINSKGMSRVKVLGNRGLSFITYILFGIDVTDSQSGLRIFSQKALSGLRWKTSGYEFCSEMLWRAKQLGLKVDEYSIEAIYTDYSKGKGQNNWNAIIIIKSLLRRRIVEMFE